MFKWRVRSLLYSVAVVIIVGALAIYNYNNLFDWWKLLGYSPPAAVAQLASDDAMNNYTKRLFYVNHPKLLPSVSSFRKYCPENEDTIVLGCYHTGQHGIYIYAVNDPTLSGIQQVTAAHEVLHSVYARLSSKDRTQLDNMLENYYKHDLHDSRVLAEVKLYQQTEPHDVYDEMSCTFGTEIANLPTGLESYYKQFFTDREKVVGYEQQYQAQFTSRMNQISASDKRLATMKQHITSEEQSLGAQSAQITDERTRLNNLETSGQISAYNASVDSFNNSVDAYNAQISSLRQDINTYNDMVSKRNALASQLTTLDSAIDTRLTKQSAR